MIFIKTILLEGQKVEITLGKTGEPIDDSVEVTRTEMDASTNNHDLVIIANEDGHLH